MVLSNSTDTFRGVTVGSTGMTNHRRTWGSKPRLVGIIRKNNYEGCDVEWNEKGQISGKKKLCLQKASDLLQNLLSGINDVLTNDFSDEELLANNLLEFLLDSLDDDQVTEL
ncbi:hypothetical protein TNCV_1878281 [Trichonephila clavipes]|nr:hypothetical protein TNCV_1878281 [Trichonephila clavipes]